MTKILSSEIFLDPIENRSAKRPVQFEVVQFEALLYIVAEKRREFEYFLPFYEP